MADLSKEVLLDILCCVDKESEDGWEYLSIAPLTNAATDNGEGISYFTVVDKDTNRIFKVYAEEVSEAFLTKEEAEQHSHVSDIVANTLEEDIHWHR